MNKPIGHVSEQSWIHKKQYSSLLKERIPENHGCVVSGIAGVQNKTVRPESMSKAGSSGDLIGIAKLEAADP